MNVMNAQKAIDQEASRRIVIYGAGGLGREVLQMVRLKLGSSGAQILGFLDDGVEPGVVRNDAAVLGGLDYLDAVTEPLSVVFGFSDPAAKERVYSRLRQNRLIFFPNVIHPTARLREYLSIGEGVVIAADVHVSVNVAIGNCVLLNDSATVGHDVTIGPFTSIMPQVAVSGNITIGERTLIGVHSSLRQGICVGSDCVIGMGSVVLRDIPDGAIVFGNPAKIRTNERKEERLSDADA